MVFIRRNDNPGYKGYVDDSERVDRINRSIPEFFSNRRVSRMSYNNTRMKKNSAANRHIPLARIFSFKVIGIYLMYAALASFLGCMTVCLSA
jgi:hypothetical protein